MSKKELEDHDWWAFRELARRQDERLKGIPFLDRVVNGLDTRSREERLADMVYNPICRAVSATENFLPMRLDVEESVQTLQAQVDAVGKGSTEPIEKILFSQADSLDAVFNALIEKAGNEHDPVKFELVMRTALKAQNQCAQTLRILGEVRNPKSVSFVRQQNLAAIQQVNNGALTRPQDPPNEPIKLSQNEGEHVEILEQRGTNATGGTDPVLASVGTQHRASNTRRKK